MIMKPYVNLTLRLCDWRECKQLATTETGKVTGTLKHVLCDHHLQVWNDHNGVVDEKEYNMNH